MRRRAGWPLVVVVWRMSVNRDDFKHRVQEATDIVALIGEAISLRPAGREFKALCPFHDDSNPSLAIVPQKQIFHCFVCQTGGDVFSWMMKFHKMAFPEALRALADRAGLEMPEAFGKGGAARGERELIAQANDQALGFYRRMLADPGRGRIARAYLAERGISEEMIEAFALGYAPDAWDGLSKASAAKGWDRQGFEKAGLIAQGDRGVYDRLRHRLIFPILDALSRPIAFGGRVLPDGTLNDKADAKYLNSPETALFHKSSTLYGLHLAKQPIIRSHTAVIVEGYTDVIACHQAGEANVVATLGTAFTREHVGKLRHLAERVVLVFDGDEAGQRAAESAVRVFLSETLDVQVAILPGGQDPADLMRQEDGVSQWRAMLEGASDALDYLFTRMKDRFDAAETLAGRQRVAEDFLEQLSGLGLSSLRGMRRAMVLQKLSRLLGMGEEELSSMLSAGRRRQTAGRSPAQEPAGAEEEVSSADLALGENGPRITASPRAERELIGCLLHKPALFHEPLGDGRTLDETLPPTLLGDAGCRRLYEMIYDWLSEHASLTLAQVLGELAQRDESALAALATAVEREVETVYHGDEELMHACVADIAAKILRRQDEPAYHQARRRLTAPREAAGESGWEDELLRRVQEHHLRRGAAAPYTMPRPS